MTTLQDRVRGLTAEQVALLRAMRDGWYLVYSQDAEVVWLSNGVQGAKPPLDADAPDLDIAEMVRRRLIDQDPDCYRNRIDVITVLGLAALAAIEQSREAGGG